MLPDTSITKAMLSSDFRLRNLSKMSSPTVERISQNNLRVWCFFTYDSSKRALYHARTYLPNDWFKIYLFGSLLTQIIDENYLITLV